MRATCNSGVIYTKVINHFRLEQSNNWPIEGLRELQKLKVFAYQNLLLLAFFLLLNQRPNSSFNIERPPTNSKFHLPILILETQTLHDNFQNKELHWSC
jgi:hypothetical protein